MTAKFRVSLFSVLMGIATLGFPLGVAPQQTPDKQVLPQEPDKSKFTQPPSVSSSSRSGRAFGQVTLNVSPGVQVELGNRSTGRITVTGWDRDVISARAVSQRGDETLIINQRSSETERFFLKADYADLESPDRTRVLDSPPSGDDGRALQIHLEVSLPRYTAIELIRVIRSNVQINNVDTPLTIVGEKSRIILKQVGAAEIHTRGGDVDIQDATGFIQVATASGAIRVTNAKSGLRAVSIAGPIEVKCARGRVDVSNTDAPIVFYDVAGDVDAIAANSSVRFDGELQEDGRYHLRSMSGKVEMIVPGNTAGFNATLSSYRGLVESDFPLKTASGGSKANVRSTGPETGRRLSGQFRNPRAQIWLDSFEGLVRLTRRAPSPSNCK